MESRPCIYHQGDYDVHFSAYQVEPQDLVDLRKLQEGGRLRKVLKPFCGAIPRVAKTTLAFDLPSHELREMPLSLKIVEEANRETEPQAFFSLPERTYGTGVINIEVNFERSGTYTAILTHEHAPGEAIHRVHTDHHARGDDRNGGLVPHAYRAFIPFTVGRGVESSFLSIRIWGLILPVGLGAFGLYYLLSHRRHPQT